MKNYLMILVIVSLSLSTVITNANAQGTDVPSDTSYWTKGGTGTVTFSSVSLTNWAAGGANSVALNGFLDLYSNYAKDRNTWDNSLSLGYGLLRQGEGSEARTRKSDDKINFTTKYGYKLSKEDGNWYFSALLDFRTQFAEGVDDNDDVISDLFAPAYLLVATGVDYKVKDVFSANFAPVTGKFTFVANDSLSNVGAFGVDPGKKSRAELGAFLKLNFQKEIVTNVKYQTKLELFTNYIENFGNIDVNWENLLLLKVNKYLSANFFTQLLYDDDIAIGADDNNNGEIEATEFKPRIQFKTVFGVGLTYNFGASKK